MNADQIRYSLEKYGIENVLFVQLNNSKTLTLTPEDRKNIKFNYDKEIVEFDESSYGQKLHYTIPFSIVEGFIFKNPKEVNNSMAMDGNSLKKDEDGKLDTEW